MNPAGEAPRTVDVVFERGARLDDALDALLACEPDLPYAGFSPFRARPESLRALHRQRWHESADRMGALVARRRDGQPLAAIGLLERPFESQHFGCPMAQIGPPVGVADEERRLAALDALYARALDHLQQAGIRHVAALTAAADRVAGYVLQTHRAIYVGTKIHWMAPLGGPPPATELGNGLRVEAYAKRAIPDIAAADWRKLRVWARDGFNFGPLVFDMQLPPDRSRGVYAVWTEKVMTGEWADALYVVRDGSEIVAFNCVLPLEDMSRAAGTGIVGRGLGATLPGYTGLFTALQRAMIADRPLGADYLENETRAATLQTINVFGKLQHQCVRSTATFHFHLGGDPPRAQPWREPRQE